jgi:hypothetical protein
LRRVFWPLLLTLACSRLPAYGRPQGALMDPSSVNGADLIEYRTLTRHDFKGEKPVGDAAEHLDAVGALTYAIVRSDPMLKMVITSTRGPDGDTRYRGQVQGLHFRAEMDRTRSWWNPNLNEVSEAYVLKHEQIHFALVALEAQALNRSAVELAAKLHAEGDSEAAVKEAVQAKLDQVLRDALDRLIDQNGKFDEDTSARYAPKKQDEWWRRVSSALEQGR